MPVEFYCPRWGSEQYSWEVFTAKVKNAGYDGIEYAIARETSDRELDEAWNWAAKRGLKMIAQHFDTGVCRFYLHFEMYAEWLERIRVYPCEKINSQTGKDYFSFEQNKKLIDVAAATGINVIHETHRNKFSFAAHITADYLMRIPELRITLDASHWVCVAESYLEDQQEAMQLAVERTDHIHARVGHPEGPQITDPRIPEWEPALEKHLAWWDAVVSRHRSQNKVTTITTEFGPFPYMVKDPVRNQPVANQWDVNVWMMELLRKRFC
jgi:sugar phosphate isomerase/epimerase